MHQSSQRRIALLTSCIAMLSIAGALCWTATKDESAAVVVDGAARPPLPEPVESTPLEPVRSTVEIADELALLFAAPADSRPTPSKHELVVHVTDTAGTPLCDVDVKLLVAMPAAFTEGMKQLEQPIAITKLDGVAAHAFTEERLLRGVSQKIGSSRSALPEFAALPEGSTRIRVLGSKPGLTSASQEIVLDLAEKQHELSLTLSRGLSIQGSVTYPDGTPVVGAVVAAGSSSARTDALGRLFHSESCQREIVQVHGISGFAPGASVKLFVQSPRPEFEPYTETLAFELSDVERNIVLAPARRISVTLRDCSTGQPLRDRDLEFSTYRSKSKREVEGGQARRVKLEGKFLQDVEIALQQHDADLLVLRADGYFGCCVQLSELDPTSRIDACLQRVKPFTIDVKQGPRSLGGAVRVGVTVNRDPRRTLDFNDMGGKSIDVSRRSSGYPFAANWDEPVETIEITRIRCAGLGGQPEMLLDRAGVAIARRTRNEGEFELFTPISLRAVGGDGWDGATPIAIECWVAP